MMMVMMVMIVKMAKMVMVVMMVLMVMRMRMGVTSRMRTTMRMWNNYVNDHHDGGDDASVMVRT